MSAAIATGWRDWRRRGRPLERQDEVSHSAVVYEKCTTQDIAADERNDSLSREVCAEDARKFALEANLRKANRRRVQRLGGLTAGCPDRHCPNGSDVQRLEHLPIDCRHTGAGVDKGLPSDRRWHWLPLELKKLDQVRMERDLNWQDWTRELKSPSARLAGLRAGLLREYESVMDGHESSRD